MNVASQPQEIKSPESQQSQGPQTATQQLHLPGHPAAEKEARFIMVPLAYVKGEIKRLGVFTYAVYSVIRAAYNWRKKECAIADKQVAAQLGCTRRGVYKARQRLRAAGWLDWTARKREQKPNLYTFPGGPELSLYILPHGNGGSLPTGTEVPYPRERGFPLKALEDNLEDKLEAPPSSSIHSGNNGAPPREQPTTTTTAEAPESFVDAMNCGEPINQMGEVWTRTDCSEIWFPLHAFDARLTTEKIISAMNRITKQMHFKGITPRAEVPYLKAAVWNYFGVPDELRPGTARRRDVRWER